MRQVLNAMLMGLTVLFFAVVVVQLGRGFVSEAFGAAMIAGILLSFIKR